MIRHRAIVVLLSGLAASAAPAITQVQATATAVISRQPEGKSGRLQRPLPPSVLWLVPLQPLTTPVPEPAHPPYTLLQKNRMFTPHVLVVPVGTSVSFPNADPFFHNVFSLYNGKRFDLGLYEKGSNRQVVFSREGVSYIFCNIHPEMSAVVLALRTPWWALANDSGLLKIDSLNPGDYEVHLWVEGVDSRLLDRWTHRVHLTNGSQSVGSLTLNPAVLPSEHTNKFGAPYLPEPGPY